uniref:Putative phosphoenolpyruvate synthase n=1 Tax=Ixodes ricinus TaxID=34613 RepID=A0A147BKS9_IXORI
MNFSAFLRRPARLLVAAWRALSTFCGVLVRQSVQLNKHGPSFLLKKAVSRSVSAWRSKFLKRRLDLYDIEALGDPVKLGFIYPRLEWELEAPQPDHEIRDHVDEFLCWGCNSSGESLLLWVARAPGGAARAYLQLGDCQGRTWALPEAAFVDRSSQESRRFSAGRLHLTCLRPMRRWRLTFNGHLREEFGGETAVTRHVNLRMFINAGSGAYDHDCDTSAEARALFLAKGPWGGLAGDVPRHDAYEQSVSLSGMFSVTGEETAGKELLVWGLRQRNRGLRADGPGSTSHFLGTLSNRTIFHVSSEKINGTTLRRGFVMAPNLFLHAVDDWKGPEEYGAGERLQMRTACHVYDIHVEETTGEPNAGVAEDSCLEVVRKLKLVAGQSQGHGVHLVLHRKPLNWRPPALVSKPRGTQEFQEQRVVCLGDASAWDTSLCGGKGSSLAVLSAMAPLSREKFAVPGTVVLTTRTYEEFRDHNKLASCLKDLHVYHGLDTDQKKALSIRICEAVVRSEMPPRLVLELETQLQSTAGDRLASQPYAVRSSAVGEDSEEMSCAGQMETFLNVVGLNEVLHCAVKCWASQFRHSALEYKWQHGQPLEAPMAVLVQQMVLSDTAGVLFTCDPVNGDPTRLVINANYGLGESVVSSLAEPDTLILERSEDGQLSVLHKHLGKKQLQVHGTAQGTEVRRTEDAGECCLLEEQALALGRVALEVGSRHPGTSDLDLEWAIAGGRLYLLQARPITSLYRMTDFEIEHELDSTLLSEDELYTRVNVPEVLPGAISPLGEQFFLHSFHIMFQARMVKKGLSPPFPETMFFNPFFVTVSRNCLLIAMDGMFPRTEQQSLMTKGMLYGMLGRLYDPKNAVAKFLERNGPVNKLTGLRLMVFLLKTLWGKEHCLKLARGAVQNLHIDLKEEQTALEMFEVISRSFLLPHEPNFNLTTSFMLLSFGNLMLLMILGSVYGDLTPEVFSDLATLLSKCEQVESADVPARLKELSGVIRKFRADFALLTIEEARSYLEQNNEEPGQLYREFIRCHGHRCLKEFDMLSIPWELDPKPLIKTLQHAVARPEPAVVESGEPTLSTPLNLWRRMALRVLVPWTKRAVARRETAKALMVRSIHIFRLALITFGRKMVQEGRLPDPRLVFHLELDELERLLHTRSPALVLKATRRQRIHSALNQLRFPDVVNGVPRPVTSKERVSSSGAVCVKGTPVCCGSVTAPARVIKSLDAAESIQPGDILVTNATDIGWSPYFPLLSGIITELGGLLSHGAVIAREYGLPCIIGVESATDIFASGDTILLNATQGTVCTIKTDKIQVDLSLQQ